MFTNNWFEITAKANFEKYLLPLKDKTLNLLEIGCYEGKTSCWMMENSHPETFLTVIDTFEGGQDLPDEVNLLERFKENIKNYGHRVTIITGKSQDRLKELPNNNFYDFIYIDGSHLAADTLEDMILSFRLLKQGGLMIIDDYTWGYHLPIYEIPAVGIDAFIHVYGNKLEVLEKNSQLVLRKL